MIRERKEGPFSFLKMWDKSKVAKGTNDDFDLQPGEF